MGASSVRRIAALGCLVAASFGPLVAAPNAQATTLGVVPSILVKSDGYLDSIRQFFLCGTAKCKSERAKLLTSAQSSMGDLGAQADAASKASLQSKYVKKVQLFVTDVQLLQTSYRQYFSTSSAVTLSGLVGNIFYLTSDVASDVNVVRATEESKPVSFSLWVEGEAATLVAMQTDASALQSSSATVAIAVYVNQLLEAECAQMLRHANGPSTSFNAMLEAFAHHQQQISVSEILYLHNKKAPLNENQVAALNKTVAKEFTQLIKTETSLVKAKK
jgi:hypothetical protein